MATATFTVFSISALWIYTEISKSKQQIAHTEEAYYLEQRNLIKSEVLKVVSMIELFRSTNIQKTTEQLQNDILNYYSTVRINHGGYIFINSYDGDALIFDGVKIIGHKNIKNLTDPDGTKIFEAELEAIKNKGGGFFTYKFKKLDSAKPEPKVSFVYGYNDWEWIIGTGVYLDDVNIIIEEEKNKHQSILFRKVLHITLLFGGIVIVLLIIAMIISSFIKKEFEVFMSFLTEKPNVTTIIDYEKLNIEELKQIARAANIVINKQRNNEQLIKLERDRAHLYLNIAEVIILTLDVVGNVTLINKKGCETLGYDVEYIVGKNWFRHFIPVADKKILSNNFLLVMTGKSSHKLKDKENRSITKSGDERIISWQNKLIFADDGTIIGSLSSGKDITERRLIEKSFSESEEKYKLLFEKSSDPVLIIGKNDTFVDCNYAALKILEYRNKDELIGAHPDKISPNMQPDGSTSIIKAVEMIVKARQNGYHRFEWLHHNKNLVHFHVDVSLTVIPILGIEYLYVVWHDITYRKKQDAELIIAKEKAEQSDNLKSSFLHNIQHEIRTPLNAILGFSQLLKTKDLTSEDKFCYFDDIINSGNQLSRIIDDIMDFSQLQTGTLTVNASNLELKKFIAEIFKLYALVSQNKKINFTINYEPSFFNTVISADIYRLKQVIGHLLSNAFKFTQNGFIELGCNIGAKKITFYVKDSGVGIEPKYFDSIFDKFTKITSDNPTKLYGGSGLGLSIAKTILSHLDGEIWVKSEVNKGSVFTFTIPNIPVSIDINSQKNVLDKSTITIVTNHKKNFNFISKALRGTEANIVHISNGSKAVEFCQNNYKTNLMVMDIDLTGMNGITTTKAIKAFKKNLPIIALCTNENNKLAKEDALMAGCDDYILTSHNESVIRLTLALCLNTSI